jgi:hypothetical protein
MLYCLFGLKVKDFHAAKCIGPVSNSRGSDAVHAHPSEKCCEVACLEFDRLFVSEASGSNGILESFIFQIKRSEFNAILLMVVGSV